ncbi:cytochrome c biogenesis protein [Actinoplanes lobatus]|uniref:Cytochrome c biogenesis protein n=1 Tax=Actinoplanes lobatus TaxID=113568 RepID=A0A7W7MFB9_9ACTN|nr:cytochrome c biogenesis protein ResB [Actinoplanes lobatus]MBB4748113.1 cytochrome c biogenesis protein [Actinoplanes lobatus]GGN69707.1 cytochrome c biogenesis protein [Actinoplanes lobatus]GIE39961.1 cytochrome c biogenesis protein [Actinoplanes lobatus]
MTVVEDRPATAGAPPPRRGNPLLALLRNSWRQLTSMRTALILLFLLAVAAVPGSIFPQRSVSRENVAEYFTAHPKLAPAIDRLFAFDVYASPWFAAIYLLLFTSLIGCVLPRLRDHIRALRTVPPDAPKRLDRLPQHAPAAERPEEPAAVAAEIAKTLRRRRWRTRLRETPDGWTVAAEKGYLKETGNLLFHFAMLAVLVGVGFGHWYGWHANRLLVEGADQGFCSAVTQFDESVLGPRVDASDLPDFCVRMTDFESTFQSSGVPKSFEATVEVSENGGDYRPDRFTVNDPLRLDGANINLIGQGYAPVLRYTDRYGVSQTKVVPFLPGDLNMTSEGVVQFPDVNLDPATGARDPKLQMGFEGVFLPTGGTDGTATSKFPAADNPVLYIAAYRGDLGLDVGKPSSVYALNREQIADGDLKKISGERPYVLRPGEKWTLDDGSTLEFAGIRRFATISIRHDPTQFLMLIGAVLGLAGLMLSLFTHRRRVWFRVVPAENGSAIEAGGLPRTDYPGFGDEFAALARHIKEGTP